MDRTEPTAGGTVLSTLRREPTLHFVLLAGALFLANAFLSRGRGRVIEVDPAEVEARIAEIESASGTTLAPEERRQVVEDYIDEQVLVREALALGLEDDARIHDFLAQKMLHVLSADVIQPTDAELERWYEANRDAYVTEAKLSAEEVVFAVAGDLPEALLAQLRDGVPPDDLVTEVPMRRSLLADATVDGLAAIFGRDVAVAAFRADPGDWVGPHRSIRGEHWLRVNTRAEASLPPLETVRAQVRLDWIVEQEAVRLERRVRELRSGYEIVFPDGVPGRDEEGR